MQVQYRGWGHLCPGHRDWRQAQALWRQQPRQPLASGSQPRCQPRSAGRPRLLHSLCPFVQVTTRRIRRRGKLALKGKRTYKHRNSFLLPVQQRQGNTALRLLCHFLYQLLLNHHFSVICSDQLMFLPPYYSPLALSSTEWLTFWLFQTQIRLQWGPSLHFLPTHSQLHAAQEHYWLCEVTLLQLLCMDRSVFCS